MMNTAPVKILYVAGELVAGGYQRQLHLLLSQIDRNKISPALVVWNYEDNQFFADDFKKLNIPLYSIPRQGGRIQRQLNLNQMVKQVNPQCIHSYTFYTNFPAWLSARSLGIENVIGSFRNDYWSEIEHTGFLFGRLCARYPRDIICNSRATAAVVQQHKTFFRPRHIWVVPNSVDTLTFCATDTPPCIGTDQPIQLLGVGRLVPQKRWDWLLSLLKDLHQSGKMPEWHFTLCGDGDEYRNIELQIQRLGLEGFVTLAGFQTNIAEWLLRSDILLLSSLFEGTPNVVAEALSCGIPVIGTDVGDVRELIRDTVDGYIVDPNDGYAFKQRLLELMLAPNLRRSMGRNGRDWMLKTHSSRSLLKNTLTVYREAGWSIE